MPTISAPTGVARPVLTKIVRRAYAMERGRRTLVYAVSADGLWGYSRIDDTGTLWEVILIPAGQPVPLAWPTLRDARLWTGHPNALAAMRQASARVEANTGPHRRAVAATVARMIDGLLAGQLVMAEPTHRCGQCRGLLIERPAGRWQHVAVCRPGCWTPGEGMPYQPCLTPERHTYCADPWPAECVHDCTAPADPAGLCDRSEDGACCGCCRPEERGRP